MKSSLYESIRPFIQQGDVIAFGGSGFVSAAIKFITRSPVSHVGVVLRTEPEGRVELIESTTLNGRQGVQINFLSDRLKQYEGDIWWLPLSATVRAATDFRRFFEFLHKQEGKPYDYRDCLRMMWEPLASIPGIGRIFKNQATVKQFYCSMLVAAAFEYADALPFGLNFAEVTPSDLCAMQLYDDIAQLKGQPREIPHFNSRELA